MGMGHILDRCDMLDVLEESARMRRAVVVEIKGGHRFVDEVREMVSDDSGEWAVFRGHDRIPLADISFCGRAAPQEPSYRGKHISPRRDG